MDWKGCSYVESVPERMHGTPVLVHSRMPADGVVDNYRDGMSPEEIAEDFGLDLVAVQAVLKYAGVLQNASLSQPVRMSA